MRQIRWKDRKDRKDRKRSRTRRSNPLKLGINEYYSSTWGYSSKGYWRIAGSAVLQRALPNSYRDGLGLRMLKPTWQRMRSA
jgi:RNA-directed DNA polymerase